MTKHHNRLRIFRKVKALLPKDKSKVKALAEAAGVHPNTIFYWLSGRTTRPQLGTVELVVSAMGRELDIK